MKNNKKTIKNLIWIAIMLTSIISLIIVYQKYNYNNFEKSVRERDKTEFTRDSEVKFSDMSSYKIENIDYNDAIFSETVTVIPNMPYKVSCMVKTENVVSTGSLGGAQICLKGTTEQSVPVSGTTDWQEVTFVFNSKDAEEVDIGFRLGGFDSTAKGTAWFSDIKVEIGTVVNDNNWKVGCFIFPLIDVDVEVNGKTEHVKLEMTYNDINAVHTNLNRFQFSVQEISGNRMTIDYQIITINEPIKTLSYDDVNGYYVSSMDVYEYIDSYVQANEYDHIYVAYRMADKQKGSEILESDWIGLGGMDYFGIGFSNIRMPDDEENLVYQYDYRINTFPEEVFVHEFLHTLERNAKEYGFERPELHDYQKYGYSEDKLEGLKEWYSDYMKKEINYNGTKIGLPEEIYSYKPVHQNSFKYSTQVDAMQEPENIIEIIRMLFGRVGKMFTYDRNMIE